MARTGKKNRFNPQLRKIVSGGQTGVDRAALDAAIQAGIETGGWCPKGRRALDGPIPDRYPMQETRGSSYRTRTRWNVRDSDATLIVCQGEPSGGTALTVTFCEQLGRPYFVHRLDTDASAGCKTIASWLVEHRVQVLNVAGPRESRQSPVYRPALALITDLMNTLLNSPGIRRP